MNDEKIKVLIIDDSATYRQILLAVIDKISDAHCVGTAASGTIALRKIKLLEPDLVLIDVVMPEMDGIATLQQIKQAFPQVEAIMVSSFEMKNVKETLRSLQIGALDFLPKPKVNDPEAGINELVNYLRPLIHLVQTKKYRLAGRRPATQSVLATKPSEIVPTIIQSCSYKKIDLVLIGISTGGPKALDLLIPQLDASMPCPLIIVQHMPPMFTESLAMKLNEETQLTVLEAQGGEEIKPKHIYIAQGGKHLILRKEINTFSLAINETPPVNNCRPSVDVLFRSVATSFTGNVLAVVMTGMGRDGTEGVRMLKRNGAKCIVQDQASSVVWGMPGSVYEAGLADEVVALDYLSTRINQLILK